jgi:hypothetical protein
MVDGTRVHNGIYGNVEISLSCGTRTTKLLSTANTNNNNTKRRKK